jgi:hypothetical protein
LIRITVQIGDGEDDEKLTVISSSFEDFDEIEDTNFIKKIKMFDGSECHEEEGKKKKKTKMGFDTNKKCKHIVKNREDEE